jgi:chemotaxis protein MotB
VAAIRKPRSVDRSSPAWLITYGDMATLLLVFFVFLFSVSEVKEQKFKAAAGSLRASMGVRPRRGSVIESRPPLDVRRRERRQKERLGLPGERDQVLAAARGKRVAFGGRIIFDRGSADITVKAKKELSRLADGIRGLPNLVDVRGHAEKDEHAEAAAKDDLELSLARAATVLRFLDLS